MRLAISNIAWDIAEDTSVAKLLGKFGVDAIDVDRKKSRTRWKATAGWPSTPCWCTEGCFSPFQGIVPVFAWVGVSP